MMTRTQFLKSCKWSKASLLLKKKQLKPQKRQLIKISIKLQQKNQDLNLPQSCKIKECSSRTTSLLPLTSLKTTYLVRMLISKDKNNRNNQKILSSNNKSNKSSLKNSHLRTLRKGSRHSLKSWNSLGKLRTFLLRLTSQISKLKSSKLFASSFRKRKCSKMNLWLLKMRLDSGLQSLWKTTILSASFMISIDLGQLNILRLKTHKN